MSAYMKRWLNKKGTAEKNPPLKREDQLIIGMSKEYAGRDILRDRRLFDCRIEK